MSELASCKNPTRSYTIALICAVLLSTTAIFIRYLTVNYHIPPLVLALWRDVFVVVTLLPILGISRPRLLKIQSRQLGYLSGYGLILAMFNALWTLSVASNGAAVATVLVYCSAAFTTFLGWWLLNESLNWGKLVAIVFSLGGCILVSGAFNPATWHTNLFGVITGICSGLGYAGYSLMGRVASERGLNPWTTLFYTFCFAAVFLLLMNLLPSQWLPGSAACIANILWLKNSWAGWTVLFALAAGPTVLGFGLYNVSLSYLPASIANLIATTEPAFTAGFAYLMLGERLGGEQLLGGMLILGGVVLLRAREKII